MELKYFCLSIAALMLVFGFVMFLSPRKMNLCNIYKLEKLGELAEVVLLISIVVYIVKYHNIGDAVSIFGAAVAAHIEWHLGIMKKYERFVAYMVSCKYGAFIPINEKDEYGRQRGILKIGTFEVMASSEDNCFCANCWTWVLPFVIYDDKLRPQKIVVKQLSKEDFEELGVTSV